MNKTLLSIFLIAGVMFVSGSLVVQAHTTEDDAEIRTHTEVDAHDADSDADSIDDGTEEGTSEGDTSDTDDVEPASYNNSRSNRATVVGESDDTNDETDEDLDDVEPASYNNSRSNRSTIVGPDDTDADGDSEDTERGNEHGGLRPVPSQVKVILLPPTAPGGDSIEARATEVRGWSQEERKTFLETVKDRAELQSGEDLENFARGILLDQENVEGIEITDKYVTLSSRVPAKLFGIFNASLESTMQINEAGEVTESLPWYSFLYSKSLRTNEVQQALQQEFQVEVDGEESSTASLELQNEFQVTARALEVVLGIVAPSDAQNHNSSRSRGNTR